MADEPLRTSVADDAGSLLEALRAAASTTAPPSDLPAGSVIGEHFVIEDAIGKGGMGAVYRARDRRLDRAVALKLNLLGTDLARAHREALALARLAHPNVVTIFEIGEHAGAPFVAMELCDGGNARTWTRAQPRTWREVLAVYLEAGKGLAAAHAAGLVHRDVKPDNILLSADGRAQIGDFGLARDAAGLTGSGVSRRDISLDATAVSNTTTTGGSSLDNLPSAALDREAVGSGSVTKTGALIGTPRYMAPEQFDGSAIDARADQFAFCVALYEAMTGVDPFPPHAADRALAIAASRLAAPARARSIPRRIHAVVARGLRADPSERWPSMDVLLAALTRAARSRVGLAVAVAVAVAVASALAFAMTRGDDAPARAVAGPPPDPCVGLPVDLTGIWNPGARAEFLRRHAAIAPIAAWAADVVDVDTAAWAAARRAGCLELPKDPGWSPKLSRRMQICLRSTERFLTDLIGATRSKPSALLADVEALNVPASCIDAAKLASVTEHADPATAAEINELRILSAKIAHAGERGDIAEAARLGRDVEQRAQALGDPVGIAIANYAIGRLALRRSGLTPGEPPLRAAYFAFRAAGDGIETANIALLLAEAHLGANQPDAAAEWLAHARAESKRFDTVPINLVNLELLEARIADARGDYPAALAALDLGEKMLAKIDDPRARMKHASLLNSRGVVLANAGRVVESLAAAEEALRIEEQLVGPDYPGLLYALGNVGLGQLDTGRIDEAIATLARAHALADATRGENSVDRAYAMWNHALALGRKDPAKARPMLDQAITIIERQLGPDHPDAKEARADRAKLRR